MGSKTFLTKSAGQQNIELYTLGSNGIPSFILLGGMHGDEPEGAKLVEDFVSEAAKLERKFKTQVLAIPRYNPDGLLKLERTNAHGVDLNRNFPSRDWASEFKAPRYFPGQGPNSEPETQALVKLMNVTKPFLVVHCHTYIPQICFTGKKSQRWAEKLARNFGHPTTEDIGYPTPGSLGQYCLLNLDVPCVCIELPEEVRADKAWNMVGSSLLEIALHGP